jgi:hypothetical protein
VKKYRSAFPPEHPSAESAASRTGPGTAWTRFWFTPSDPLALHVVRVLAGLLFLAWLLPFAGHLDGLFGMHGWFDEQAYADAAREFPEESQFFSWSVLFLFGKTPPALTAVYWAAVAVVALFTLGVCTRLTAILAWVFLVSFTANPAIQFDADCLLTIPAFYLMVGYVLYGLRRPELSWAGRLLGPCDAWLFHRRTPVEAAVPHESVAANLALRLLQVHFAIVIVCSGLHKLQISQWWGGVALWYPLYPPFEATVAAARTHVPDREEYLGWLSLAAYVAVAWQLAFPLFAWRPGWRRVLLLGGAAVGWLVTALVYRLPVFGPAIFLGCLAYVTADEWRRLLARLPGLQLLARPLPESSVAPAERGPQAKAATSFVASEHR